jgi:hypothetical protein
VGLRRLRAGEWLAAAGGAALIVSLLLPWYGDATGFEVLTVVDVLLVLVAAVGFALAVLQATQDSPARPVGAGVVTVPSGFAGVVLVIFRLVDSPGDAAGVEIGAYLGLAATVAITVGGWLSIANERVRGLPPGPEPELRPSPRIADRAQP